MSLAETGIDAPRASLHDRLVNELRRVIVTGAIADGARIPEMELCMRFGVSRTPLREALKSLSVEGLVTLRPNRGSVVTPLDKDGVRQAFEAKGVLEGFIGVAATERAGAADLAAVTGLHERLAEAAGAGDAEAYTRLNTAFHRRMAELAGNGEILAAYERLQTKILRVRYRINHDPARVETSLAEHDGIMAALSVRAGLDVAARLVAHNDATARVVLEEFSALKRPSPTIG